MIGNDIVDLKQAAIDYNWQRPRFLEKVFTPKEQEYISASKEPHQMVWLLWSMKEAAYKVNVQQFGKRFFNPKKLECGLVSLEKGMVLIGDESYFTTSEITEDYVYTVATLKEAKKYISERFKISNYDYKSQSEELKQAFLKTLSKKENDTYKLLEIKKNNLGVPQLYNGIKKLPIAFSLTHCGNYAAYSTINT